MAQRPRSWGAGFPAARGIPRVPAELAQPIATTRDGRDITAPWVRELHEPRDHRLLQSADWGVYERIRLDDQVKSCMEQRIRAVVSRDWDVLPGSDEEPRADAAAQALKLALERAGWDRVTEKMLWATFYGYSVGELMWQPIDGLLQWGETDRCRPIHVRHARRFRLDADARLRLLTTAHPLGEVLPDRKFWMVTAGGTDDDTPYGQGLAEWLYWPTLFKRNGVRFWNIFLDKFSVPTAKGTYPRGSSGEDINKLLAALQAIANDSGFVVPEGMAVELLQLAQSGADFDKLCRYMDAAIAKIILSQTMTTDNGSSRSQGEVHADVKLEVVKADADLLSDSFNSGPSRWFTDFNFGPDVAAPLVVRLVAGEDDLKGAVAVDEAHARLGWRRTDDSFKDRYGDGYERAAPTVSTGAGIGHNGDPKIDGEADDAPPSADSNVVPLRVALAETIGSVLLPRDVVDDAVDAALADEGWRHAYDAVVEPLVTRLQAATSADEVAAILTSEAELADTGPWTELLARASFAVRIDALTDDGGER